MSDCDHELFVEGHEIKCVHCDEEGWQIVAELKALRKEVEKRQQPLLSVEDRAAFAELAQPLMTWMAYNLHPHMWAIVDGGTAMLLEGCMSHKTTAGFPD